MKEKLQRYRKQILAGAALVVLLAAAFWVGGGAPGLQGWSAKAPEPNAASAQYVEKQTVAAPPAAASEFVSPDWERVIQDAQAVGDIAQQSVQPKEETPAVTPKVEAAPKTEEKPADKPAAKPAAEAPQERPGGADQTLTATEKVEVAQEIAGQSSPAVEQGSENYSKLQGMDINAQTGTDSYQTQPVPEGRPVPVEPQDVTISDKECTCTLSVRCDTILSHMDWLVPEKASLVPADGVIFPATTVTFYEGESVFNVLQREMKKAKIHMEFASSPIYNSAYIEGINNLYEFDCGQLSGWMYRVNDWYPNYGCSRYALQDGDTVEWVYTCDLGVDVGGYAAAAAE